MITRKAFLHEEGSFARVEMRVKKLPAGNCVLRFQMFEGATYFAKNPRANFSVCGTRTSDMCLIIFFLIIKGIIYLMYEIVD